MNNRDLSKIVEKFKTNTIEQAKAFASRIQDENNDNKKNQSRYR